MSALTARRPLTMALRRWKGIFIRPAASTWETPRGSRNSFKSISPGWVGGRRVGSIEVASMTISAPYVERVTAFETEHDSILIVHAHGVQPSHATAERVQPVAGRNFQILEARDGVDLIEFAT